MLRSEFLSAIVTRSTLTKVSSPFISISNYTLQPPLTMQSFSVNCSQLAPSSPSFLVRDKIVPKVVPKLSQSSLKVVQQASFPQAYNLGLGQLVNRATLVTLVKLVSQLVLQGWPFGDFSRLKPHNYIYLTWQRPIVFVAPKTLTPCFVPLKSDIYRNLIHTCIHHVRFSW